MLDLSTVTDSAFNACLEQTFTIEGALNGEGVEPISLSLVLVEVERRGALDQASGGRVPFSLLFRGQPDSVLSQGIYRMNHADIGALELFLVPIGPDAEGMRYEAILN